jgi:hypothetical protein
MIRNRLMPRRGGAHPLLLENLLGTSPLRERVNGLDLVPGRVRLMVSIDAPDDDWLEAQAIEEGVSRAELLRRGLALLRRSHAAQNGFRSRREGEANFAA